MLEVKNLTKIYKSKAKNGADTRALDGVTLSFPERGMVFLLGKSGSGKSTLLNVCGGLDEPTDGEIIVKGRSSKAFSQSDFDSYRNTFIGFIFQEYNILNEFSVEDNIALALELQGKSKDKKRIAELLEQVDLTGFAKRKPNTLSGGQKQRIAIARALVKSPEIIMADEPTGALDSATGKQVFDTLKKLSEDKLVIVVSHDREFAELYADRIIELKDGKILSDVSKAHQKQTEISKNVSSLGDVLCIKQGSTLSESDLAEINSFLKSSAGDVIIAKGDRDVENFRKVSRITADGEKEIFADTDESVLPKKEYTPKDSRFIRSKLPARHAAKIGVSGLKSKPVRLLFTILLCVISFVLFGLLSTLSFYDSEATFKKTFTDSTHTHVTLGKEYQARMKWYRNGLVESEHTTTSTGLFSEADMLAFREKFGPDVFGAIEANMTINVRSRPSVYWISTIKSIAYLPEENTMRSRLIGNYPTADDEIGISTYVAELLRTCQALDKDGNTITATTNEELIGKTVTIDGTSYKITCIIDSGAVDSKFDSLKEATGTENYGQQYDFERALEDGMYLTAFFSEERVNELTKYTVSFGGMRDEDYREASIAFDRPDEDELEHGFHNTVLYKSIADAENVLYKTQNHVLGAGEVVVSEQYLAIELREEFYRIQDRVREEYEAQGNYDYYDKPEYTVLNDLLRMCDALSTGGTPIIDPETGNFVHDPETGAPMIEPMEPTERAAYVQALFDACETYGISLTLLVKPSDRMGNSNVTAADVKNYTIVGVVAIERDQQMYGYGSIYLAEAEVNALWELQKTLLENYSEQDTNYVFDPDAIYSTLYLPYDHSREQTNYLWTLYNTDSFDAQDTRLLLKGSYIESLRTVDEMVQMLSQIFLYVGLALALFAILLFSNFISVSISQKKREIGILRAVGARSIDVFKIFFSESFVIALIAVTLSVTGSAVLCSVLNTELGAQLGASIFVFGVPSIAIMLGIAFATAVLATFLPVYHAARKKPVESIRAL